MAPLEEVKTNMSKSHPSHPNYRKPSVTTVLKDGDVPDNFESLSADEAALVALDDLLRVLRCPRSSSFLRQYAVLWNGIRWYWRNGLGMAHLMGFHPMCRYGNGRALL